MPGSDGGRQPATGAAAQGDPRQICGRPAAHLSTSLSPPQVGSLRAGDRVATGLGGAATIRCVVQYNSLVRVVTLAPLPQRAAAAAPQRGPTLTLWHPVLLPAADGAGARVWQFPARLPACGEAVAPAVRTFVLHDGHAMVIDGVVAVRGGPLCPRRAARGQAGARGGSFPGGGGRFPGRVAGDAGARLPRAGGSASVLRHLCSGGGSGSVSGVGPRLRVHEARVRDGHGRGEGNPGLLCGC